MYYEANLQKVLTFYSGRFLLGDFWQILETGRSAKPGVGLANQECRSGKPGVSEGADAAPMQHVVFDPLHSLSIWLNTWFLACPHIYIYIYMSAGSIMNVLKTCPRL